MKKSWAIIGAIVLCFLVVIGIYNNMLSKDEAVKNAVGNLEATLQRRLDLVPNLVNTVKGYAAHESITFQEVTKARSQAASVKLDLNDAKAVEKFQKAQHELQSSLSKLMVVVEQYPNLKASANFMDLQAQLEGTENRINIARQNLNKSVQEYNICIRKFPNSLINRWGLGLTEKFSFKAVETAQTAPKVEFSS